MYFNSQPHEEADGYGIRKTSKETISTHSLTKRLTTFQPCLRGKKTISTHSLTKRLTHYIVLRSVCTGYFNSQPHEEADERMRLLGVWEDEYFNSQPHEEADISPAQYGAFLQNFNSQPHEEADQKIRRAVGWENYFNSQPHEEADPDIGDMYNIESISTHSLTKRLTDA